MVRRVGQGRSFAPPQQAESARPPALAVLALLAVPLALASCVNSNLLDPPALFETTSATLLSTDCGTGKGTPEAVVLCADVNTTAGDPITFTYYIPTPNVHVVLLVYDVHGAVVARLTDATLDVPDWHTATWNLRDAAGTPVPFGNYRVYLKVGGATSKQGDVTLL